MKNLSGPSRNEQLFSDLRQSSRQLEQVVSQVRGTAPNNYSVTTFACPAHSGHPGRPITLAVTTYSPCMSIMAATPVVSMRLSGPSPSGETIPDVEIIYDLGRPMRKVHFGFPAVQDLNGFASATTELSIPEFPTSARMIVTRAVPDELLSQR